MSDVRYEVFVDRGSNTVNTEIIGRRPIFSCAKQAGAEYFALHNLKLRVRWRIVRVERREVRTSDDVAREAAAKPKPNREATRTKK
jgi:hypothetical protein